MSTAENRTLEPVIRQPKPVSPGMERRIKRNKAAMSLNAILNDDRSKVPLPNDNRTIGDFATDLGNVLRDKPVFRRDRDVVVPNTDTGTLELVTADQFRTLVEKYTVCYRERFHGSNTLLVKLTMSGDEARATLASHQFKEGLRAIARVNTCQLPVQRASGVIELLPTGYDAETRTLTLSAGPIFQADMGLEESKAVIDELLGEFVFTDATRSRAVAVSAMTGLFVGHLLPSKSLRPCFIYVANAEGAGKTLLAQCCILPTFGTMPAGSKAAEDAEMRKALTTAVREARQVIFFDNLKGHLSSGPLEAFCSAPEWNDRVLGGNTSFTGDNIATVFITGNGLTVSPDMRRRSLFVELHLAVERAEDRQFKRQLDYATLLQMRARILAALWGLVRHWDTQGRPEPSRTHSAFPAWAKIVGGIVETAGFGCALETPQIEAAADTDGADMRRLVEALAMECEPVAFKELVGIARKNGCFEWIIGITDNDLKPAETSRFGRLLARYDKRQVGIHHFLIEGKGHGKRFRAKMLEQ